MQLFWDKVVVGTILAKLLDERNIFAIFSDMCYTTLKCGFVYVVKLFIGYRNVQPFYVSLSYILIFFFVMLTSCLSED